MTTTTRALAILMLSCSMIAGPLPTDSSNSHSPGTSPGGGHSGLPDPRATLLADEVEVPFVIPETFPVPVVEVTLNGTGPWRLAVDTAMGGTILLRQELVREMGLPIVGRAMVGDSSGLALKPAELVRIDLMRLGQLEVRQIIGIGFAADESHLNDVPKDIHGILGNRIYAELLATLDYPGKKLVFRSGEITDDDESVVEFDSQGNVMVIDVTLAGRSVPLIVDSGSRGTITLPESMARELPLRDALREIPSVSTVSNTYSRRAARLNGSALLAGTTLTDPEVVFADEHTPRLIGYGVLKHFALTIDQAHGRLRWTPAGKEIPKAVILDE